ncbi:MAG: hypothetical protein ACFFG0_00330 [Candidatus Thorarchaeota archaeon]
MEVVNIIEREDGSATLELDLTEEEITLLVGYAVIDILKKEIDKQQEAVIDE